MLLTWALDGHPGNTNILKSDFSSKLKSQKYYIFTTINNVEIVKSNYASILTKFDGSTIRKLEVVRLYGLGSSLNYFLTIEKKFDPSVLMAISKSKNGLSASFQCCLDKTLKNLVNVIKM